MAWEYIQPVKIKFGNGTVDEIKNIAKNMGCKNGLLVSAEFFVKNGLAQKLISESEGTIVEIFAAVEANPTVKNVDDCSQFIKEKKIEFIVALGGGSALDCAKAAATIALTEDSITKYHGTGLQLPKKHLPLIAVPTTAGTGSEVTCVSVLTNKELQKKAPIASEGFYPDCAVIDPELTYSMTPYITACTGIDVLSHAIEGFWSKNHQPICDALAIYAAELVFKYLYKAYENPNDKLAREKMSEASLIAGMAFSIPKTTGSHACSFPLTNIYRIPHGEACGLTLDYFAIINADIEGGRLQDFSKKLGFKDVSEMADKIYELKEKMGLRCDLKEFNLSEEQIEQLVQLSKHPNLNNNPIEISDNMLYEMYQSFK